MRKNVDLINPSVSWPINDLTKAIQRGVPSSLLAGKNGSLRGIGMGKQLGETVSAESHRVQLRSWPSGA
uniref:Uncharacterized protein n=1 Tax=Romanomermis culicivorax TaxID=13658 RepID=A0A915I0K1_ROMCU